MEKESVPGSLGHGRVVGQWGAMTLQNGTLQKEAVCGPPGSLHEASTLKHSGCQGVLSE